MTEDEREAAEARQAADVQAAYQRGLEAELAGYEQHGRTDRAEQVRAELAKLGATTGGEKRRGKAPETT